MISPEVSNPGEWTIRQWLSSVQAPCAAWAGGSVAALTAAQAWALLGMVTGVSLRGRRAPALLALLNQTQDRGESLIALAQKDTESFQRYLTTRSVEDLNSAISTPLDVAKQCLVGLAAVSQILPHVKPSLKADLKMAVRLLQAALLGSMDNARTNCCALPDHLQRDWFSKIQSLSDESQRLIQSLDSIM